MTGCVEPRRILLIKPSSLGDVVHALPVLHGLRHRFPAAHIAWLVSTSFAPLIEDHPHLDEVIEFDRRRYGRLGRSLAASTDFLRFVRELRARQFDTVIDLQGLFRSGFLARATGASTRIGFRSAREFAWTFYTHRIKTLGSDVHAVDKNYRVAALFGFDDLPIQFDLAVTGAERERAARLLEDSGVDARQPFVAVLPGARWQTKRWLPERFAEVIRRLQSDHGLRSVLMGSPDEAPLCDAIAVRATPDSGAAPANLAGKTGVRDMASILERAAIVLCQDSAPSHLAAALDRPIVCIVGPTNPRRTGPYGSSARLLQAGVSCSPCYLRSLVQCPYGHKCMELIQVDQVVEAVTGALAAEEPHSVDAQRSGELRTSVR